MSINNVTAGEANFDQYYHQTSYVFVPATSQDLVPPLRPSKRRKISKQRQATQETPTYNSRAYFQPLLSGIESSESLSLRHLLFEESWARTDKRIKSILLDANEDTLAEVTSFINKASSREDKTQIPTGLIVTGPNIASQDHLFNQIAGRLKSDGHGHVVLLRSGDAPNLKALLKKLIRDATNQKGEDEDDVQTLHKDGPKLLNYDLQILYDHVKSGHERNIVIAFQDSEAFDSSVLSDTLTLFSSWLDRIPIIVLLGVATSIELFQERLPRAVTKCLYGHVFEVEQTSEIFKRIFQKVVAGSNVPLHLGPNFVMALQERQKDHVQSLQTFISALRYTYMCHFYANPLSILLGSPKDVKRIYETLQPHHVEAIRMLPSFRKKIEALLDEKQLEHARGLLESDEALLHEVHTTLELKEQFITQLRRNIHLLAALRSLNSEPVDRIELYIKAFSGQLQYSDELKGFLDSIKTLTPYDAVSLMKKTLLEIDLGDPKSDLDGWKESAETLRSHISRLWSAVDRLLDAAQATQQPVRSKYSVQSKVIRTTVVAQKVQLSRERSSLSELDVQYSNILDELTDILKEHFTFGNPLDQFLHEVWLYDSKSPYREVFTPKPRHVIERALSVPHDYLGCTCCRASEEGLSSSQPPTAIIYQLYLETGGLINVFDLWSAFSTIVGGDGGEDCDERMVLALFYRALADLKLLGMVKQSRKKTDHLAKLAWKGL